MDNIGEHNCSCIYRQAIEAIAKNTTITAADLAASLLRRVTEARTVYRIVIMENLLAVEPGERDECYSKLPEFE